MTTMNAHLTFYPISKNLIKMTNQLHQSISNNARLIFNKNEFVSHSEISFYKKNFDNIEWHPWLWSRIPRRTDNTSIGWELYFNEWNNNIIFSENKMLNLGKCANSIFNLNNFVINYINNEINKFIFSKNNISDKKLIGIHIRRGDQKNISGENYNIPKYIHIDKYIKYIKEFPPDEYDFYISSEDNLNIFNILKDELPEYNFIINSVCNNVVWSNPNIEGCIDIEGFCSRNPENIEHIVLSALLDLHILQRSHIFIGPIKHSAYSYIAYLLALGKNENVSFIDLSTDISDLKNNQFDYLNQINLI